MPRRVTVDQNGFIVSMEAIPERKPPQKRATNSNLKKSEFPWTETQAKKTSKISSKSRQQTKELWVFCTECQVNVKKANWEKHLRKCHSVEKSHNKRKTANCSDPIPQLSTEVLDQPERSVVDGRSEYARKLLRELHEETRIRYGDKVHSASPSDNARKGTKQPKGETVHPACADISETESTSTNRSIPKREAKKRAKSFAKEIATKQKKAEKLREEIRAIGKELKKLAPGFHRIKIARLQEVQGALRKELKKLERTLLENEFAQGRFPGRGGKLGARTEQHKEDLLRSLAENEYGGGKYLGHMRREHDGRFGSLPVYEDYGEESFPY